MYDISKKDVSKRNTGVLSCDLIDGSPMNKFTAPIPDARQRTNRLGQRDMQKLAKSMNGPESRAIKPRNFLKAPHFLGFLLLLRTSHSQGQFAL
jgi:hypothetical protein